MLSPVDTFSAASESAMIELVSVARNQTLFIFFSCLQKCSPSHCPVCRAVYRKEKIKKLHVETNVVGRDEVSRISSPSAISEYLHMVAMVSGEGVLDVEIEKVSVRVDEWVASLPQNLKLQVGHLFLFASAFSALCFLTRTSITPSWLHIHSLSASGCKFSCV